MTRDNRSISADWPEKGLPTLIDRMMEAYESYGDLEHLEGKDLPSRKTIIRMLDDFMMVLFPNFHGNTEFTKTNIRYILGNNLHFLYKHLKKEVEQSLKYVCHSDKKCNIDLCERRAQIVAEELLESIPRIKRLLVGDINAAYDGDPAATSHEEIVLSYPCVLAIATYRIAHELHVRGVPIMPRIMGEYAHSVTGIDIHPGATIGENFFIDHGTGVVIGETSVIGNNVRIYQGVTLGGLSLPKDKVPKLRGNKRHPTIEDNVIIYSGATILGGKTVVGKGTIVGGNVWITSSIPSNTIVTIASNKLSYRHNSYNKNRRSTSREKKPHNQKD